ncbi:MAG: 1-acyl-sn-glycerol-3-phosphate acyltransferase [Microlunatus sp.]|nr:1-acyl-sn-glycerol-3-phosphate acyltransferase [Microlunatus sp.]
MSDIATLACGWQWARRVKVARTAIGTAVATVKGADEAPPVPTGWSRTPFAVAVRDVLQTVLLRPVIRAEVAVESYGVNELAGLSGPTILVANHASHLDVGAVLCTLPAAWRDRSAVALTSDRFFHAFWKASATALAFNTVQLPESAQQPESTAPAERTRRFDVDPLVDVLSQGWHVLVFPEGGRTRDGVIGSFHPEVAAVAAQLGVTVVPVGIRGTFTALPQGARWARRGRPRVAVRYGTALRPQAGESAEVFTARLHAGVADLIDEDATTWWQVRTAERTLTDEPGAARWRRIWRHSQEPTAGGRPRRLRIWRS